MPLNNYICFLKKFDSQLETYFKEYSDHIFCKKGCSSCCEQGDYPLSETEVKYLMQGYLSLKPLTKIQIQNNIKEMKQGGKCPFLINNVCSVYSYRPLICRVHGLAYFCNNNLVKVPYCVNQDKNYSKVYVNGEILIDPIQENLDTINIVKNHDFGEIRNLYDWINLKN